ncbi:MAG: septal ring lytic transglycosylase RlpA family protein [Methylosarcina sp.]
MITRVNAGNIFHGGWLAIVIMSSALSGCSEKESDADLKSKEKGQPTYKEVGEASWYGPGFHGRETASGVIFDQREMTAAHPTLPLGTDVEVTNLENKKKVEVEITDRGPYAKDRAIDLSKAAAKKLDMKEEGVSKVKIVATEPIKKKSQADKKSKKKTTGKTQAKSAKKRSLSTKNKKKTASSSSAGAN